MAYIFLSYYCLCYRLLLYQCIKIQTCRCFSVTQYQICVAQPLTKETAFAIFSLIQMAGAWMRSFFITSSWKYLNGQMRRDIQILIWMNDAWVHSFLCEKFLEISKCWNVSKYFYIIWKYQFIKLLQTCCNETTCLLISITF